MIRPAFDDPNIDWLWIDIMDFSVFKCWASQRMFQHEFQKSQEYVLIRNVVIALSDRQFLFKSRILLVQIYFERDTSDYVMYYLGSIYHWLLCSIQQFVRQTVLDVQAGEQPLSVSSWGLFTATGIKGVDDDALK